MSKWIKCETAMPPEHETIFAKLKGTDKGGFGYMKLWVDDIRPAPEGYRWYKSVNAVKCAIRNIESCYWHTRNELYRIELIDIDHDAGDYAHLEGTTPFVFTP